MIKHKQIITIKPYGISHNGQSLPYYNREEANYFTPLIPSLLPVYDVEELNARSNIITDEEVIFKTLFGGNDIPNVNYKIYLGSDEVVEGIGQVFYTKVNEHNSGIIVGNIRRGYTLYIVNYPQLVYMSLWDIKKDKPIPPSVYFLNNIIDSVSGAIRDINKESNL